MNPMLWIAGLAAAAGLLFGARSEAPAVTGPSSLDKIEAWAREKLARARSDWAGPLGARIREWSPLVLPGIDPTALCGFAQNGGRYEDTAFARDPNRGFHELGYFGVEGGTVRHVPDGSVVPAVSADRADPWNAWAKLATHPMTARLLGRPGAVGRNAWQALDDQVAIGLLNIRRHMRAVYVALPPSARPSAPAMPWYEALIDQADLCSYWAMFCASSGWSAGDGRWAGHVDRWLPAGVPEADRASAMARSIATAIDAHHGPSGYKHASAAYTMVRTMQKLRAGELLARSVAGDVATGWYTRGMNLGPDYSRVCESLSRGYTAALQHRPTVEFH